MNEIEVKVKIDSSKILFYKNLLEKQNFTFSGSHRQVDFVLDTPDLEFRKNGLILRIRDQINKGIRQLFLTLKIKKKSNSLVQDNEELEVKIPFSSEGAEIDIYTKIKELVDFDLDIHLLEAKDWREAIIVLSDNGLTIPRSILEKNRTEYKKQDISICFDTFIDHIGIYMEIETQNYKDLHSILSDLDIDESMLIEGNYGQIARKCGENIAKLNPNVNVNQDILSWLLENTNIQIEMSI